MNAKTISETDLARTGPHRGNRKTRDLRELPAGLRNLNEAGRYLAKDVCHLGDVPFQARTLLDQGCVTGPTVVEKLNTVRRNEDQCVVRPVDQPLSATRGNNGLMGRLTPACAAVKVVGMAGLKRSDPARFDGEQACGGTVNKTYREGEVLVIRYAGPHGGPGIRNILAHGAVTCEVCHAEI